MLTALAFTWLLLTPSSASATAALPLTDPARWQKLDRLGAKVAPLKGPWHCVQDNATGLVWEVKTDNETLHYNGATYSWFDRNRKVGSENLGSCAAGDSYYDCDSQDLIDATNQEKWCGYSDWRLPTSAELTGILFWQAASGEAKVISTLFPYLLRSAYWTGDLGKGADQQPVANTIHLGDGSENWLATSRAARVLLVRGSTVLAVTNGNHSSE